MNERVTHWLQRGEREAKKVRGRKKKHGLRRDLSGVGSSETKT